MPPRRPTRRKHRSGTGDASKGGSAEVESDEDAGVYSGAVDGAGVAHGRGTLLFSGPGSQSRFEGRFDRGLKHGLGRWVFGDESDSEVPPDILSGRWNRGVLQGPATYFSGSDGTTLIGTWVDDVCEGAAIERYVDGSIKWEGTYAGGVRHGAGKLYLPDGGLIEGHWEHGVLEGDDVKYVYPDQSFLHGRWQAGEMVSASYVDGSAGPAAAAQYRFDPSTDSRISSDPLLADPYEEKTVFAAPSTLAGAGEGLFAKRDIPAGWVVSWYNGIRTTHSEVDRRKWQLNSNTISLDDDTVIDVPYPYSLTSHYVASLGHKANHALPNNAVYAVCIHPRFGHIKCIRAIVPIRKGEEITVDYGYKPGTGPQWYRALEEGQPKRKKQKGRVKRVG